MWLVVILGMVVIGILLGLIITTPFIIFDYLRCHKIGRTCALTGGVIITALTIGIGINWWRTPSRVPLVTVATGTTIVQPKEEWLFEWESSPDKQIRGFNKVGPWIAEIKKRKENDLWIDLQSGHSDETTIRLIKDREGSYYGTWRQESTGDHGSCELHGDNQKLTGMIIGTANIPVFCKVWRK